MKSSHLLALFALTLFAVNLAIFGKSLQFDFVPYDDPAYVTDNGYVNQGITPGGLRWALWYRDGGQAVSHEGVGNLWHPLTWLSHMLDVSLFGTEDASGHHLSNLLLHGVAAILLMLVAYFLVGSAPAAFLLALLWMIHPLKVESVAWVSERKDVLSGVFAWAALACALFANLKNRKIWRIAALVLFVFALLSKPSVVILPLLLILAEGFLQKERAWGLGF
ncbi:hypothetical protein N9891_01740 [bacterium]|nr:hypothetical protein [bacterium]